MGNRSSAQQARDEQHHDHDWPEIEIDETRQEPVGSVLGHHNEVPVYSCSYKFLPVVSMLLWKGIQSHTEHGHYCGMKWQCVELARRYMIKTRSMSFDSVGMAWEIFDLPHAFQVADPTLKFKFESHKNGAHERPKSGDLLIWRAGGKKIGRTGHVAVIVDVSDHWVRIIEQNWEDSKWHPERNFSRQIHATVGPNGQYTIREKYIRGWKRVGEQL